MITTERKSATPILGKWSKPSKVCQVDAEYFLQMQHLRQGAFPKEAQINTARTMGEGGTKQKILAAEEFA